VIRHLRIYWGEFRASVGDCCRELREDRHWLGLALLVVLTPLLFVSAILAALTDIGPE
jgi:hypothetical protein